MPLELDCLSLYLAAANLAAVLSATSFSSQIYVTLSSFTTALAHFQKLGVLASRVLGRLAGRRLYLGKERTRRTKDAVWTFGVSDFGVVRERKSQSRAV